jgi:cytochrome P450
VWEAPHAFRPERFAPEARKRIPKGAYVPSGGGSRICLGMRFGQPRSAPIATAVSGALPRRVAAGFPLRIRQTADSSAQRVDLRCESWW